MRAAIEKHPFLSFIIIAFGWTWPLAALIGQSMVFPLLALFGPCLAAVIVLYASRGRAGFSQIGRMFRWSRALVPWGIVAAVLPLAMLLPCWLLHGWWWGSIGFEVNALSLLSLSVAVLIVGEEVGWRGFLLPYLLQRHTPLTGSLIVGLVWGIWHLPNFLIPNYPHHGLPLSAFVLMTLAFSVLFTWLYLKTAGSLAIAVIFHAALNFFRLPG
jgi:membrane protease YdiL (CAAX protease family)